MVRLNEAKWERILRYVPNEWDQSIPMPLRLEKLDYGFSAHATPSANTPLFPFFHGKKLLSPESQGQKIYTILYPISEIGTLILCLDGGRVDG